jgi:hypothetical protein
MSYRRGLLLLAALLTFTCITSLRADPQHVPDVKVVHGKGEHVLAGIDVDRNSIEEVLKRFGKPTRQEQDSAPSEGITAQRRYVWDEANVRVEVVTAFSIEPVFTGGRREVVTDVTVDGRNGEIGRTGRGLKLGDSYTRVAALYGNRFERNGRKLTIEWDSGASLFVEWNKQNLVTHIELALE